MTPYKTVLYTLPLLAAVTCVAQPGPRGGAQAPNVPVEPAVRLTPPDLPTPRINGARVFGVRPGNPFLYTIAATGQRPMTFSVDGLPEGLKLNESNGQITGVLSKAGEYTLTLKVKNSLGTAERKFKIVCGQTISLTPALGWNSWNCFASAVTDEKVRAAADAMVSSGLINHGWTYINIDDYWQVHRNSQDKTLQGPKRAEDGRILPNPRFPDMKKLTDYVHGKGLKIGLYSSPGPWTCGGCVGSFGYELQDAKQYADWGFDYLKYDWCSYHPNMETNRGNLSAYPSTAGNLSRGGPNARTNLMLPYKIMQEALMKQPRDILYSLCQYGNGNVWEWGTQVGGNSWRTTGDINDSWNSMAGIGFRQAGKEKYAGPGHWNDPDMLVVGYVGWGPRLHPTKLTPNEQYTHISLWSLLCSPLLIGCDMTKLDDFTLGLLCNDEVIEVNQDPLGQAAGRVLQEGTTEVWAKTMEDGSKAIGIFNRGETETNYTMKWSDLSLAGKQKVRDLWRQQDMPVSENEFKTTIPRHGAVLIRASKAN